MSLARASIVLSLTILAGIGADAQGLQSNDLYRFRSVSDVQFSPDQHRIAYAVAMNDRPGRPYSQVWVMDVATRKSSRIGAEKDSSSSPRWSPDGKMIAFAGGEGAQHGLSYVMADGSGQTFLCAITVSNSQLPGKSEDFTWSPDSRSIAYVSSTPGPETQAATGDPIVITRYLYKPAAGEGLTHFSDNKRLHLYAVDIATKQSRQLTSGNYDEQSIDWSPNGQEIVFASNHEPNSDEFFQYDLFALKVSDGSIRRITATESTENSPHWSPDGRTIAFLGTSRGVSDPELTMQDTHAWLINSDGSNRREIGAAIDNRQHFPHWAPDGSALYIDYQEAGSSHLARLPLTGGKPEVMVATPGAVGEFSVGKDSSIAFAFSTAADLPELYLKTNAADPEPLTALNTEILKGQKLAEVSSFRFASNDNKFQVEAFLTKPLGMTATSKHPLIVNLHGGPHFQNGPAFDFKNQAYAALGMAVLQINYRGSAGYGQKFADAVFGDQDGNDGQDILYGVSAAVRRYLWIDRERMGLEGVSYGGQLSDWLITQTNEFKAAIPTAGIANLISYNYTTNYNQYEEMEFGQFFHQGRLMDEAWERSALKHVAAAHTPTMLVHGENDPDVPIAQAEQYFVALKDVGVDTIFVRYPREGHALHETKHIVDWIDRSVAWYQAHFPKAGDESVTNVQP